MASVGQNTAGVLIQYGIGTDMTTEPTTFNDLPNITGYPDLVSDPNTEDVTPLSETKMVINIPLLMDLGILAFPAVMTRELIEIVNDEIIPAQESGSVVWFRVKFPAPLDVTYSAPAMFEPVYPTSADANGVVRTSVRLTPKSAIAIKLGTVAP